MLSNQDRQEKNIHELVQEIQASAQVIEQLTSENKILKEENLILHERIKLLLSNQYGSQSERFKAPSEPVFDEPQITAEKTESIESAEEEIRAQPAAKEEKKTGRRPLPAALPREEIICDLPETERLCTCGSVKSCMGEEVSEQLEYIPAKTYVRRFVVKKYACRACDAPGIIKAKMPQQPLPKSLAGPGLLAQILTAKYLYHLPLYRQEAVLQSAGVDIPRATTSLWVIKCAELLRPLVNLLGDNIRDYEVSYADETRVQVLKEASAKPGKQFFMWCFSGGRPQHFSSVFVYSKSRAHSIPLDFFGSDYTGYVHCDGYSGYESMSAVNQSRLVGCLLHARRKFFEITKVHKTPGLSHQAMEFFNDLAQIEQAIREQRLSPEDIKLYRTEHSKPILDRFKAWLDENKNLVPPKFPIGEAISYTLNQWPKLIKYLEDGRLEWSNNLSERLIKAFATGRKNWIFCNSIQGAEASSIIYSLIMTCRHHKIEVYEWLRYALTHLPSASTLEQIESLLPYNVNPDFLKPG